MRLILPMRRHTLLSLIDLLAWIQGKNHRAYLSHRRKRLRVMLSDNQVFSLTVDRRFCSISSHKCPYSLGAVFFERETVVPQI